MKKEGFMRSSLVPRWNLFARELEDILAEHGLRLGHLNDRVGIHPEKVRRLQQSLIDPRFHVVSPEELERIGVVLILDETEMLRLRAAVLATAVEALLMDRIHREDALAAAEQLLPLIQRALRDHVGEPSGMGAVKGELIGLPTVGSGSLEQSIDAIDRGMIALHLCYSTNDTEQSASYALIAREQFRFAITTLEGMEAPTEDSGMLLMWLDEARKALQLAMAQLARVASPH